ncbi:MAG: cupin domain-containing protein [Solirubrobacteraceae bacterium]
MSFLSLAGEDGFELAPGAIAKAVFGEGGMLNVVELAPGAEVALHSHPHEQLGLILTGSIMMHVDGESQACGPMDAYVVPGGIKHGGKAGSEGATVLDVFVPVREDYRERAGATG